MKVIEECPEDMKAKVAEFKELLKNEPKLHVRTDDNFMLRYLRASEGNVSLAFDKLKNYYQLKREQSDMYATQPPEAYKDVLSMGSDYILEDRDSSGKRIWIHTPNKIDTAKETSPRIAQMQDLILETILDEPDTQKEGVICIVDMNKFPLSLIGWFTANIRTILRKSASIPFTKIEYHIVNTSIFFKLLLKVTYPFMNEKQKESLFIHGDNWESLHKIVDPSVLPEEFGGKKPNRPVEELHDILFKSTDTLTVNLKLGYRD